MTQFEKYYRIWFADEVEPAGGFWCYYGVDKNRMSYELNFDYTDKEHFIDSIDWYIENGYKIEQIDGNQCNCITEPTGHITQVAFADTPQEAEQTIFYMKKYDQLKEVIENMVTRLDEGGEMMLTKDSIIVLALKEAIK